MMIRRSAGLHGTRKKSTSKGKRYYQAWRTDPAGNVVTKQPFATKRQAEQHGAKQAAVILDGRYVDHRDDMTLRQYVTDVWSRARATRANTRASFDGMIDRYILVLFGDRMLRSLLPSEIQTWSIELNADSKLSQGVKHRLTSAFAGILRLALDDEKITRPLASRIKHLPKPTTTRRHPDTGTLAAVLAAAPPRYRALIEVSAGCGLRPAEALGITLDVLTLPLGTPVFGTRRSDDPNLCLYRQLGYQDGRMGYRRGSERLFWRLKEDPRSDDSEPTIDDALLRIVPLSPFVVAAIIRHVTEFPVTHPAGLVFTDEAGRPIARRTWSDLWARIAETAGIPKNQSGRLSITPHSLRHWAGSALAAGGVTEVEAARFLGHSTGRSTTAGYTHPWEGWEDRCRTALEAAHADVVRQAARIVDSLWTSGS